MSSRRQRSIPLGGRYRQVSLYIRYYKIFFFRDGSRPIDLSSTCRNCKGILTYCKTMSRRKTDSSLQWHHNELDGVSDHQPPDCLLNRLFRLRSKKTSKPRVTGLCVGNSPVTGEIPAQKASNAENVSIWWRHHVMHYSSKRVFIFALPYLDFSVKQLYFDHFAAIQVFISNYKLRIASLKLYI